MTSETVAVAQFCDQNSVDKKCPDGDERLHRALIAQSLSLKRYANLYEFAPVPYLSLNTEGRIAEVNKACSELMAVERRSLLHRRFSSFICADHGHHWREFFTSVLHGTDRASCDLLMLKSDGGRFYVRLHARRPERCVNVIHLTLTEITSLMRADEYLRMAAIAFESQEGMIITDPQVVILQVNRAFTRLTGYSPQEAVGRTPALLSSGRHDKSFYQRMWNRLKENDCWQGEIWNRRKNGKIFPEWLTVSAVHGADGSISHYVGSFSEITRSKDAEAEIHRLAYYDSLTRLPNRRLLHDRVGQAMATSIRSGNFGALLFLDLDHFKTLNDTCGHAAGDQLLIETAQHIKNSVRLGDTVARLGGDEFVVILEELSVERQEAAIQTCLVGEKIRAAIARPFALNGREFVSSASIGVVLFKGVEESVETLIRHADMAMYQAKNDGRNNLRFFDPAMQTTLDERSALESDLRLALERGQLQLHYQPQMNADRQIIGAEALLRWTHPERGLVSPNDFIPLAEATGLILPIGKWVLEAACAQIESWARAQTTRHLRLAINVSASQFRQPSFGTQVRMALECAGADPAHLKIELTESVVIDNVADTIASMQAIKSLGISFSMDDFGTGFSSLSYLKRLPLDQLKIDRSFVRDLATDANDAAIVQTIITMGRTLGLDIIAEGVETEAQLERLASYGCTAYQGFLFSRPLPITEFERLVEREQHYYLN